jgi:hypothetical protein
MTTNSSTSSAASTSAIHALAVGVDTKLADINGKLAYQRRVIHSCSDSIARADRAIAADIANGRKPSAQPYGIDISQQQARIDAAEEKIAELEAEADPLHDVYDQHRWSRFFLVLNTNGHIHRSTFCATCFPTTEFGWLPEVSGLTEAEAVAAHGEILCSVCYPSAPVEWTSGISNSSKLAKAEAAAKKAERDAKKLAKALIDGDPDGGIRVGGEWINTISAAKTFLTDAHEWNSHFPRTLPDGSFQSNADGTVQQFHPHYTQDRIDIVADALAVRLGTTPEAQIEAARKRALKRR